MTTFDQVVEDIQNQIHKVRHWVEKWNDPFNRRELHYLEEMLVNVRSLHDTIGRRPYVQRMEQIVENTMKHYLTDFYYHDMRLLSKYGGLFYWYVSETGTHFVRLEVPEDEITDEFRERYGNTPDLVLKEYLDQYGGLYTRYLIDQQNGTVERV